MTGVACPACDGRRMDAECRECTTCWGAGVVEGPEPVPARLKVDASSNGHGPPAPKSPLFTTRPADLSAARPTRFLWRPYLVQARLNLLVGEEGAGKSTVETWIAARATRGELDGGPVRVLFVGADEDAWNEVVVPRLFALDADLAQCEEFVAIDGATIFDADKHARELGRVLAAGRFGLVVFEQLDGRAAADAQHRPIRSKCGAC